MSPWQITPCVQVQRKVAAIRCRDKPFHVYWSLNFCENLCLSNRIFLLQPVVKNQMILNLCNLSQGQRFSQKLSSTHEAICCCDVLPWHVVATCCLKCIPTLLGVMFSIKITTSEKFFSKAFQVEYFSTIICEKL